MNVNKIIFIFLLVLLKKVIFVFNINLVIFPIILINTKHSLFLMFSFFHSNENSNENSFLIEYFKNSENEDFFNFKQETNFTNFNNIMENLNNYLNEEKEKKSENTIEIIENIENNQNNEKIKKIENFDIEYYENNDISAIPIKPSYTIKQLSKLNEESGKQPIFLAEMYFGRPIIRLKLRLFATSLMNLDSLTILWITFFSTVQRRT